MNKINRLIIAIACMGGLPSINAEADVCITNFPKCSATSYKMHQDGNQVANVADGFAAEWHDGFVLGVGMAFLRNSWCPSQPFSGNQLSAIVFKIRSRPP